MDLSQFSLSLGARWFFPPSLLPARGNSMGTLLRQMSGSTGAGLYVWRFHQPLRCWHYRIGSDFLKASHDSHPTHTTPIPIAVRSSSVCADHALATDRLPNTDAR